MRGLPEKSGEDWSGIHILDKRKHAFDRGKRRTGWVPMGMRKGKADRRWKPLLFSVRHTEA